MPGRIEGRRQKVGLQAEPAAEDQGSVRACDWLDLLIAGADDLLLVGFEAQVAPVEPDHLLQERRLDL